MNKKFILYSVGKLLEIISFILCVPAAIAIYECRALPFPDLLLNPGVLGFLVAIPSAFCFGFMIKRIGNKAITGTGIREGFAIVTFGWATLSLFGAIPVMVYLIAQYDHLSFYSIVRVFTDAYFEIMSGFSTTGATILTDIEAVPKGLLFWRSLTHWLGGMGIVTLAIAILPVFGVASYQMFRGEVPGPTTEQLSPRLAQTAKILWVTYGFLTLAETGLLTIGGMSLFDALCHSFATMATGGFSTKAASIAAYDSAFIQWVIIVFMFFAGMNFLIHFKVLRTGNFDIIKKNTEFHFYVGVLALAVVIGVVVIMVQGMLPQEMIAESFRNQPLVGEALVTRVAAEAQKLESFPVMVRHVAFQVVSITTTTGYCTADFDMWPNAIRYMLVVLMFFGGCAGSTGGGMKMIRIMIMLKAAGREIQTMIQPRLIKSIKIAGEAIEERQVSNVLGFIVLFVTSFAFFVFLMSFYIDDFTTAFTVVAATICNIGPGLSGVGATESYAWIPLPGKWILTFCMLLGRLEIYTVFIAFSPISWKK